MSLESDLLGSEPLGGGMNLEELLILSMTWIIYLSVKMAIYAPYRVVLNAK